jgi:hypothetical protein
LLVQPWFTFLEISGNSFSAGYVMTDKNALEGAAQRPDAKLSRRSLVAAGALLGAMVPFRAKKAAADVYSDLCPLPGAENFNYCKCFLSGTHLLTPDGEVAIEKMQIGDWVATASGESRVIRWIGRIVVDRSGDAPWRPDAMPVRVSKNALGVGSPSRDLYLSRSHMVHLNGVLMPIGDLINGRTITPVDVAGDRLTYYHIELETHDVLIAEGAPCESFLTTAEKLAAFDNADEYYALYGVPTSEMVACAPLAAFNGGRSELKSRLRSAVSPIIDIRRPADVARDHIEARALLSKAA